MAYRAGVTARSIGPNYAVLLAPERVYMVDSYRGTGDDPHFRTLEKGAVTAGSGAHDESVGIEYVVSRDSAARQVLDFGERLEYAPKEGDFVVADYQHSTQWILIPERSIPRNQVI